MTSRRSNDSEGDDSVIGGFGEPVKRLAHPAPSAPESHVVGMRVMDQAWLLYKPSPPCNWGSVCLTKTPITDDS